MSNIKKTTDDGLYDLFKDLDERADQYKEEPVFKIAIISTPRSGSSMFCDVLRETGLLGEPREWINMRYLSAYGKYTDSKKVDFAQYLEFVKRKTTSSNGCFSLNFHVSQFVDMHKRGLDIMELGFDRIYALSRKNKLAQAYSLSKAELTDQWSASSQASKTITGEIPRSHILRALFHISESEEYYEHNLKHLVTNEFSYEDFSNLDSTTVFQQVFRDCKVDVEQDPGTDMKLQREVSEPEELRKLKQYLGL